MCGVPKRSCMLGCLFPHLHPLYRTQCMSIHDMQHMHVIVIHYLFYEDSPRHPSTRDPAGTGGAVWNLAMLTYTDSRWFATGSYFRLVRSTKKTVDYTFLQNMQSTYIILLMGTFQPKWCAQAAGRIHIPLIASSTHLQHICSTHLPYDDSCCMMCLPQDNPQHSWNQGILQCVCKLLQLMGECVNISEVCHTQATPVAN